MLSNWLSHQELLMGKSIFHRAFNNPFLKNVSTLALGTIISQLLLFLSSPILTRLFSATDFGILALFNSIAVVAAILTTGRYEFAVGLPESDKKASKVVGLIVFLSFFVSVFYLFVIIVLKNWAGPQMAHNKFLNLPIAYLVPVLTFAIAIYTALQYWNQRFKAYKIVSTANAALVILGVILNIVFGVLGYKKFGLVYSLVLAELLAIIPVAYLFYRAGFFHISKPKEYLSIAKEYKNFPKYMLISDLSLTTSQQIVPIIFTIIFNSATVGFYSLANRMLKVPSVVLTSSIGNVFRNDAIDIIRSTGSCRSLYLSTLRKLIFLAIPIYSLLAIFSPQLFVLIFGKNWVESGYFARIICFSTIFDFLAYPLSVLFYVVHRQKMYMRLQFFNMLSGILFIYVSYWLLNSAYWSVLFFSINNAIFSMLSLYITYDFSKQTHSI